MNGRKIVNFVCVSKHCGLRPDCSLWSSLIWVHTVCNSYTWLTNLKQKKFDVNGGKMFHFACVIGMEPYTEYNASLTVCTEVGCTRSTNTTIMMPESEPEGK